MTLEEARKILGVEKGAAWAVVEEVLPYPLPVLHCPSLMIVPCPSPKVVPSPRPMIHLGLSLTGALCGMEAGAKHSNGCDITYHVKQTQPHISLYREREREFLSGASDRCPTHAEVRALERGK